MRVARETRGRIGAREKRTTKGTFESRKYPTPTVRRLYHKGNEYGPINSA